MKIGFLIPYFYPIMGGAENNCYYLARELAKKHEVHVFCSGNNNYEEKIEGINVHRIKKLFSISYYLNIYPRLTKEVLKIEFDIIHIHGFGFIQNELTINKIKEIFPKTKIVCTPHGPGPFMAQEKFSITRLILKRVYCIFLKKLIKKYDIIIEVNPFQKEWLVKEYNINENRIKFIPNGINKEIFKPEKKEKLEYIKNKYKIKSQFVISYLGRVNRYKGLEQIINIMANLKKIKPNLLFLVMGKDAGDTNRLKKLAQNLKVEENIIFIGEFPEEEKAALLELSEIFIFPSEWEAFGIAILEAMARKNVIVSTKTEGGRYLIKENKNGFLFDYGDKEKLQSIMIKLLKNDKIRKIIKQNNYVGAKSFLWDRISKDLEKVYIEVIK